MATDADDGMVSRLRGLPTLEGEAEPFDPGSAPASPAELFAEWLEAAIEAGVLEPHAMTLSTVDAQGRPSSRVLILKGLDDGRWMFATSRESRKGGELADAPWAALSFYWPEQGRQVRLRGRVLDAGAEESTRDFLDRPDGSRAASLAGNQSAPLADPSDVDRAIAEAEDQLAADPGAVPEHWALFHLIPDEVEFWQSDRNRRHVRLQYRAEGSEWSRRLLWP